MSPTSPARWRKSSYSSQEGGACVEVAVLWRKSSHSSQEGGECVEVAGLDGAIGVRDSKDPEGPHLILSRAAWQSLRHRLHQ